MFNTKSPQAQALIYTILLSALSHLLITLFLAIINNRPELANMFNVLGISLLVPALGQGPLNALLGGLTVIVIWTIILGVMKLHEKKQKSTQKEEASSQS